MTFGIMLILFLFQHTNRVLHVRYDEEILKRLDSSSSSLRLSPGAAKRLSAASRWSELGCNVTNVLGL